MTTLALKGRIYAADFSSKHFVNATDPGDAFSFADFHLLVALTKFAVRYIPQIDVPTATAVLLASLSFDAACYLPASSDTKDLLAALHARARSDDNQRDNNDASTDTDIAKSNKLRARRLRALARQRA